MRKFSGTVLQCTSTSIRPALALVLEDARGQTRPIGSRIDLQVTCYGRTAFLVTAKQRAAAFRKLHQDKKMPARLRRRLKAR